MENEDDLPPDTPWWAKIVIGNVRDAKALLIEYAPIIAASMAEVYGEYQEQVDTLVKSIVPVTMLPHVIAFVFVLWHVIKTIQAKKGTK